MIRSKSARYLAMLALVFIFLLLIDREKDLRAYGSNPPDATVGYGSTRSSPDGTLYSGTECTITGTWWAGTGETLVKVELWVGNVRRYVQEWPSGTGPTSLGLIQRKFSSTQFNHNSTMTLKAKCWNTASLYDEDSQDKIAWNRGYVLYNTDLNWADNQASVANTDLGTMNHGTSGVVSTHNEQNIRDNIPNYGLFYISTHGSQTSFRDCLNSANSVTDAEVGTAVGSKTNGQCPYTFVFLDACLCATTNTFLTNFSCATLLGFEDLSYDSETYYNWTKKVWDELAAQATVSGARATANDTYPSVTDTKIWGNSTLWVHVVYPGV